MSLIQRLWSSTTPSTPPAFSARARSAAVGGFAFGSKSTSIIRGRGRSASSAPWPSQGSTRAWAFSFSSIVASATPGLMPARMPAARTAAASAVSSPTGRTSTVADPFSCPAQPRAARSAPMAAITLRQAKKHSTAATKTSSRSWAGSRGNSGAGRQRGASALSALAISRPLRAGHA